MRSIWRVFLIGIYCMKTSKMLIKSGAELLTFDGNTPSPSDFNSDKNVILLHGFTATSVYLKKLGSDLHQLGFNVFYFNYNSYKGIDKAAEVMSDRITNLDLIGDGCISSNPVNIVAHSMGGLVARSFCQMYSGTKFVSSIFSIGTPHNGTLNDATYVDAFVKFYESLAGSGAPKGYRRDCRSLLQLTQQDKENFIEQLNSTQSMLGSIKLASISGGKRYLEIGKIFPFNRIANRILQIHLGNEDNDGLVCESSSSWKSNNGNHSHSNYIHFNNYPEYLDLNHSYLIENQSVALKIATFIKS